MVTSTAARRSTLEQQIAGAAPGKQGDRPLAAIMTTDMAATATVTDAAGDRWRRPPRRRPAWRRPVDGGGTTRYILSNAVLPVLMAH
jgi:hypothetical protein